MKIEILKITRSISWWAMVMSAVSYMIFRSGQDQFLFVYLDFLAIMDVTIIVYFFFLVRSNAWRIKYPNIFILVVIGLLLWYFIQSKMASFQWVVDSCSWQLAMLMGYFDCTIERKSIVTPFKVSLSLFLMALFAAQLVLIRLVYGDPDGAIIFSVYYILVYIAFILEQRPTALRNILLAIAIVLVLGTSKRTGTISMLLALWAVVLVENFYIKPMRTKSFLNNLIKTVLILGVALYFINEFLIYYNIPLFDRILIMYTDNSANGRTVIWENVISSFANAGLKSKIIGFGYHATQYVLNLQNRGIMAHNDFLEVIFDYGYIGIILLIGLLVLMCLTLKRAFEIKSEILPAYLYLFIITIPLMMFSYFFVQSTISVIAGWFIGRVIGKIGRECVCYAKKKI